MENSHDRGTNLVLRLDRLPFSQWHRTLFIISFLGIMFDAMDFAFFGAALPAISKEFKLGPAQAGMLATIGLVGAFIGALLWGSLSDYIGRKTSFQATVGIFAIFTGLMSASWSVASLAVTRFFANIGLGGEQPVTGTLFTEYMPSKVRGKASGNMLAAFPAGMVVAALIGLLVVPTLGWRVLFIIGVAPAILIFFIRRSVPESVRYLLSKGKMNEAERVVDFIEKKALGPGAPPRDVAESVDFRAEVGTGAKKRVTVFELFSPGLIRRTILVWIVSFGFLWSSNGIMFMLPTILVQRGFSLKQAISFILVQAIFGYFGYSTCSFLIDSYGRRPVLFLYYLMGAAFHLWFAYASGFWMYAAIALVGWVNPGVYGGNIVYVSELYPTHLRATGVGWFFGIGRIGSFLAPAVVGFMMASGLGKYVLHTFAISYFVSAIALIAVGIETRGLILEKSSATRSLSQNSEKA